MENLMVGIAHSEFLCRGVGIYLTPTLPLPRGGLGWGKSITTKLNRTASQITAVLDRDRQTAYRLDALHL
jgi:hypothetical protein